MPIGDNGYIGERLSSMFGPSKDRSSWLYMPGNLSFEEMRRFLSLGKVDIESCCGKKSWQKLYEQVMGKDVRPAIPLRATPADIVGRIVLVRWSAKVTLYAGKKKEYRLREKRRVHEDGTEFVNSEYREEPSISETRKIDEKAIDAAVRGLWEELGLRIEVGQLKQFNLTDDHPEIRPSRVYPDIFSLEIAERFSLELPERPWEDHCFTDDGVRIYMEWVPSNKR